MESNNLNTNVREIDLLKLFYAAVHRWWIFAITCSVAGIAAAIYTFFFITPLYESSVSIFINNRLNTQTDYISSADITTSRNLVKTYIAVASSDKVMTAVSEELGGDYSESSLKEKIKATQVNDTELIMITVTTPDPYESAKIANAVAEVIPDQIAQIVEGSSAKVIDYAKIPNGKSYPSNTTNVLIGILLGAVLGAVIVFIEFITDVRIKETEDINALCDYPILGQIPDFATVGTNSRNSKYGYANSYAKAVADNNSK